MNKKTVIYILGCVLVFVSAFMLLPWFVSLIFFAVLLFVAQIFFVYGNCRLCPWKDHDMEKAGKGRFFCKRRICQCGIELDRSQCGRSNPTLAQW